MSRADGLDARRHEAAALFRGDVEEYLADLYGVTWVDSGIAQKRTAVHAIAVMWTVMGRQGEAALVSPEERAQAAVRGGGI